MLIEIVSYDDMIPKTCLYLLVYLFTCGAAPGTPPDLPERQTGKKACLLI
jgi:hypothetical protein